MTPEVGNSKKSWENTLILSEPALSRVFMFDPKFLIPLFICYRKFLVKAENC